MHGLAGALSCPTFPWDPADFRYYWTCSSPVDPDACVAFEQEANANGNTTSSPVFLYIYPGDDFYIDLTVCLVDGSQCSETVHRHWRGFAF